MKKHLNKLSIWVYEKTRADDEIYHNLPNNIIVPKSYIIKLVHLAKDITEKYNPEDIDEELSYLLGHILSLEDLCNKSK